MAYLLDVEQLKPGLIIYHRADVRHRQWYCRVKVPNTDRYKVVSVRTNGPLSPVNGITSVHVDLASNDPLKQSASDQKLIQDFALRLIEQASQSSSSARYEFRVEIVKADGGRIYVPFAAYNLRGDAAYLKEACGPLG